MGCKESIPGFHAISRQRNKIDQLANLDDKTPAIRVLRSTHEVPTARNLLTVMRFFCASRPGTSLYTCVVLESSPSIHQALPWSQRLHG